ncbi:hypothetical protein [Erythrobacter alti]|uniref:hypothetical protein n=1 Tax=Erythrobacter alti TaxID=1896145 RepID=UPI0030F46BD4
MNSQFTATARIVAAALIVTVATQIIYITVSNMGGTPNRPVLWSTEVVAFIAMAIGGLALLPSRPVIGAGIAVGGMLNVIQASMGLVMFAPLTEAGEAMAPAFSAVLSMAFALFFAGKVAFGVAAIAAGRALWSGEAGFARIIGALAGLAGLAAVVLNALAIFPGTDLTFPAGGAGTAAALFLAMALTALRPVTAD